MTDYRYSHTDGDLTIDEVASRIIHDPEWEDHREHIVPLAERVLELLGSKAPLPKGVTVREFTDPPSWTKEELEKAGAVFPEPNTWGLGPGPSFRPKKEVMTAQKKHHLPRVWVGDSVIADHWHWGRFGWMRFEDGAMNEFDIFTPGHQQKPTEDPREMDELKTCKVVDWTDT